MFGKLSLDAVPFHEPIVMRQRSPYCRRGLAILAAITLLSCKWTYLRKRKWLTSVDHITPSASCIHHRRDCDAVTCFADAIMMRSQYRRLLRLLKRASYRRTTTIRSYHHGVIMIFRGDALRYRSDEPGGSAADRRARRCVFPNNLESFWFTVVGVIPGLTSRWRANSRADR